MQGEFAQEPDGSRCAEDVIKRLEGEIQEIVINEIRFGQRTRNIAEDIDADLVANLLAGAVLRTALYYFVQERDAYIGKTVDDLAEGITRVFAPGLFLEKNTGGSDR